MIVTYLIELFCNWSFFSLPPALGALLVRLSQQSFQALSRITIGSCATGKEPPVLLQCYLKAKTTAPRWQIILVTFVSNLIEAVVTKEGRLQWETEIQNLFSYDSKTESLDASLAKIIKNGVETRTFQGTSDCHFLQRKQSNKTHSSPFKRVQ